MHRRHSFIFILLSLIGLQLQAQLTISPYSRYGVGEIISSSSVRNTAMGGLGIGITDWGTINRFNPASYTDLRLSTLEVSAFGAYRSQQSGTSVNNSFSGGYQNVAFGFPSNKSFSLVMGLSPYSSSEYDILLRDTLPVAGLNEPYLQIYNASGGLNQFYLGTAIKLFRKVSLGANFTYTFGSLDNTWITAFEKTSFHPVSTTKQAQVGGVRLTAGVQYEDTLRFKKKVDLLKENAKAIEEITEQKEDLVKDEAEINAEKAKLDVKRQEANRKKEVLEANRARSTANVEALRENGAPEKVIARAEAEDRKYSRKIKKIDLKINTEQRIIQNEERLLKRKRNSYDKLIGRFQTRIEEIKKDSTKRFETREENLLFRFGAIVEPGSNLNGDLNMRYTNYNGVSGVDDTLYSIQGAVSIPLKYGFGVSIGRPGRWVAGIDMTMQNWGNFSFFDESSNLGSSLKINAGGEIIPDRFSLKFHKRVAWRFGGYFENTGLSLNNVAINEYGLTFGVGIPMRIADRASKVFSRVNLGITWANRGTTDGGLLQESVLKMSLGVNLNERMFRQRRVD